MDYTDMDVMEETRMVPKNIVNDKKCVMGIKIKICSVNICNESRKMDQEEFCQGVPDIERF